MHFVEPIKDERKISAIKNILKGEGKIRDYLLFSAGVNFGLRASDLLRLRVSDVFDGEGNIKESFELKEQKTGKWNKIAISPKIGEALKLYWESYPNIIFNPDNYLFFAQKTFPLGIEHIKRNQAWKLIQKWCQSVGLQGRYGTHTFRKTLGFYAFRNNIPLEVLSFRLNHSDTKITRRYIGLSQEETQDAFLKLDL